MTVWVEKVNVELIGECYEISTEYHDGIIYFGKSIEEAVARYEDDRGVKVTQIIEIKY